RSIGRKRCGAEGLRRRAVDHELQIDTVVREVDDIQGIKRRRELLGHDLRVLVPETEAHDRADVSEDRLSNLAIDLPKVLMREHQPNVVFAKLREHRRQRERGEIVELVGVHPKVRTLVLRYITTTESRPTNARNKQGAKKRGAVTTNAALCQIHQQ